MDDIVFREDRIPPICRNEQIITGISYEDEIEFPEITGDCVYIHDNDDLGNMWMLPNTVKYLYIANNHMEADDPITWEQFRNLIELHIGGNTGHIEFPRNLIRLTIESEKMRHHFHQLVKMDKLESLIIVDCGIDLDNFERLPKNLQYLQFSDNSYSYEDYKRPLRQKGQYLRSKDNSKILRILYDYKKKHPKCHILFNKIEIKTKIIDMNKKAYNIMELEEFEITQFLADNENHIVGKCYNELVFIDRAILESKVHRGELFKISDLGFGINNSYIQHKYIEFILESEHKFWLFERNEEQHTGNKTMFSVVQLKDANSILGNIFQKYSKTLKKKRSIHNSTIKRSKSKSKSKSK
jgi:hypothetical protein